MNNLQIIKQYHQALWDKKDITAVDLYFQQDCVVHSPVESIQGTDKMKSIISQWYRGFPDLTVSWDDFICEADKVVSRWHSKGTNTGEFLGHAPTNKEVNYAGITIYKLANEKIQEYWALVDMRGLMSQLGIYTQSA